MIIPGMIAYNNKTSITLNPIYGYPKIYLDECRIFPLCTYEEDFYSSNLEEIYVNKMQSYNCLFRTVDQITILDSYQPLLIIHCPIKDGCFFEISYFYDNNNITLKEHVTFNQNILKGEKNNFIIDFKNNNNIIQIIIDIIIFNGNIDIDLNLKYKEKIFILNKFEYIIDVNSNELLKNNFKIKLYYIRKK